MRMLYRRIVRGAGKAERGGKSLQRSCEDDPVPYIHGSAKLNCPEAGTSSIHTGLKLELRLAMKIGLFSKLYKLPEDARIKCIKAWDKIWPSFGKLEESLSQSSNKARM